MDTTAAAGYSRKDRGGTTRECLLQSVDYRPTTPPEIRKFRRSTNLEPGRRFIHHGIADDLEQLRLDAKIHGAFSEHSATTAADLLTHSKAGELERINNFKSEQVYKAAKREKLGATIERGYVLPKKFSEESVPFGVPTVTSADGTAKDIIFPELSESSTGGQDLYIRSHGSYGPGEQKNRHYQWPVDPRETRFGCRGDGIALNGASKNINDILKNTDCNASAVSIKKVEDFRGMGDLLGKSRNLGQGSAERSDDTVYGKPSTNPGKKHYHASEIIRGKYTAEQQLPDKDLGKSIMPGFRNISTEDRAYGCPSIRTDLPQASSGSRRSLADSQNFGNDATARDLICPPAFADLAIPENSMGEPRSKARLAELFSKIGYSDVMRNQRALDTIFDEASGGRNLASINDFRNALNAYLLQD